MPDLNDKRIVDSDYSTLLQFVGLIPTLEILDVFYNDKSSRVVIPSLYCNEVCDILKTYNLHFCKSEFGFIESIGQFNNATERVPIFSEGVTTVYLYIGPNFSQLYKMRQCDAHYSHVELGLMLGYPRCCIDFFCHHKKDALTYFNDDYSPISAMHTKGFGNKLLNTFHRVSGHSIVSHFPCSFNCLSTLPIASRRVEILHLHDKELLDDTTKLLSQVVNYSSRKELQQKITEVDGVVDGDYLEYSSLIARFK